MTNRFGDTCPEQCVRGADTQKMRWVSEGVRQVLFPLDFSAVEGGAQFTQGRSHTGSKYIKTKGRRGAAAPGQHQSAKAVGRTEEKAN